MVEHGPEDDAELATIEETDSDISGCNWARIEAIKSDCENEEADNDPEEVVDDDPDEDDCCSDDTVCKISGCICDTTAETMSD